MHLVNVFSYLALKEKIQNIVLKYEGNGVQLEKQSENCLKINVFVFFYRILTLEEGYYKSEICKWQYSYVPLTIWNISNLKRGNYFSGFVSIFPPISPTIRHSHSKENYFFEISKTRAIISQLFI